jgi:hypothetical protein
MPEFALARNSCDLAKTASKSLKAPGEQNCNTGCLEKISPKAQAMMTTTEMCCNGLLNHFRTQI